MANERQMHELDSQLNLLSRLIQTGPIYQSKVGQQECVREIAATLERFGWDKILIQNYTAREVSGKPNYVPVHKFGGQYVDDLDRPKRNIIAVMQADRPGKTLILNGHYDVELVADHEDWTRDWHSGAIESGKVWGRGASDMLAGLTSQIYAASRLACERGSWRGRIIFNAVADEEIGGNGTLASLLEMSRLGIFDGSSEISCLIAEPSNKVIALESLGFLHMSLRARGQAQHMAGISLRENVLYEVIDAINNFDAILRQAINKINPLANNLKHIFGILNGGIDAATPMPSVEAQGTILYPVDTPIDDLKSAISREFALMASRVEVNFSGFHFDGQRSPKGDLYSTLLSTRPDTSITGGIFPSPCDARLFSKFGIENVITYGPGSLAQAHKPNEYIAIDDIELYNNHLEAAIRQYLGC